VPARFPPRRGGPGRPGAILDTWWKVFDDPAGFPLGRSSSRNLDLRIAAARLMQARALAGVASSAFLPEGGLTGEYQRIRRDEAAVLGAAATAARGREQDFWLAGFDAAWEIDVFGGIRRQAEAADADRAASRAALRAGHG
jgi:outer membrane protein TolC